jgi:HEAT repeat protein
MIIALPLLLLFAGNTHARDSRAKEVRECLKNLRHKDPKIRKEAARKLGRFREPDAVKPLLPLLRDKDYFVRRAAASSLGLIGDSRAIKPMIKAALAKGGDRNSIVAGLRHFGEEAASELVPYLRRSGDASAAEEMIVKFGIKATFYLVPLLKDGNDEVVRRVLRVLAKVRDKEAVEPIIELVEGSTGELRRDAIAALGEFRDRRSISALTAILEGEKMDDETRAAAAFALGSSPNDEVIAKLKELLSDKSPKVRAASVRGLHAARARNCIELYKKVFESDKDFAVKLHAAFPLALNRKLKEALEFIVEALKNRNRDHRLQAAIYLRDIKDDKTTEALIDAMREEDETVRFHVNWALREITRALEPYSAGTYKAWRAWWLAKLKKEKEKEEEKDR